jgi:hypothetical protein
MATETAANGSEQLLARWGLNLIADDVEEVVYSREMAEKTPTVAVLTERVSNNIIYARCFATAIFVFVCFASIKLSDHGEKLSAIHTRLNNIEKKLDKIIDRRALEVLTSPEAANAEPQEVADAAARAKARNIPIKLEEIQKSAEPLLENVTPAKWEAVRQLLNLRSFQNSTLEDAKLHVVQFVKPGEFARERSSGEWAELDGGAVTLDGDKSDPNAMVDERGNVPRVLGYVIFKRTHVIYNGGKVTLVNVFFDDCTFTVKDTANGIASAKRLLEPPVFTNFSAD